MSRVLITGITGYIGSNLARDLLGDYEVWGLVREPLNLEYLSDIAPRIRFLHYDGTYAAMSAALDECRPDLVYHLAAYYTGGRGAEHIQRLLDANVTLGGHLLEAMSGAGTRALVYATTYMTHYRGESYCPVNLYAATKRAFSDLLAYYTDAGWMRAATLVISDTYGPNDHRPKVLNVVKRAARTGERVALTSGTSVYDVLYIDDAVSAFRVTGERLLEGAFRNEVFQIVPEEPLTLRETVEKLLEVNGLTLNAGWGERPPAEREMADALRIYPAPPGWRPRVPLEEGLRRICGSR